jgi:two-component system chemotaxis sensor kinase CheA
VRVRTDALDRILSSVGEVILSASQLRGAASGSPVAAPASFSGGLDRMERVVGELQRRALELRTTPLLRVMEQLPRVARELAQRLDKRVEMELVGAELELDRSILDRLGDPLVHLIRNAVDHGIEAAEARRRAGKPAAGRIVIEARRDRDTIRVAVRDDGAGIDLDAVRERAVAAGLVLGDLAEDLPPEEIAALVFRPGLSTARAVSEVSGRGVGMDAVKATIESLGGRVELESRRGLGTVTTLVVPITAAIQRVLLLGLAGETVAVPIAKVERIVEVATSAIERSARESFALVDDEPVLVIDLAERLGLPGSAPRASVPLVLTEVRDARLALRVEELQGQQEIYVKPVPDLLAGLRGLAGLTVLGDGRPIFLLDLNHLV